MCLSNVPKTEASPPWGWAVEKAMGATCVTLTTLLCSVRLEQDPTDSPKPVLSTTPASWDSSTPFTQGTDSSPPVTPTNPISR